MSIRGKLPETGDRELAGRARRGDVAAYEALVRRYQEVAFRAAWLITRDAQEAEDAVQEAFVKAYHALGRFRAGASFKPWMLRIATNEARNRRKSAGRRARLTEEAGFQSAFDAITPESPEGLLVAGERRETVLAAISELREEEREVVYLSYFLDLSERETARALGCAKGTVKSRLSRALGRMREKFGVRDA